jgi:ABC-type lipoprotein export system ATPase subunit
VDVRKKIGFIFQRHNLFESLTALQNVRMSRQLRPPGDDDAKSIAALLTRLGLGERLSYKPARLSGAQRQRDVPHGAGEGLEHSRGPTAVGLTTLSKIRCRS